MITDLNDISSIQSDIILIQMGWNKLTLYFTNKCGQFCRRFAIARNKGVIQFSSHFDQ